MIDRSIFIQSLRRKSTTKFIHRTALSGRGQDGVTKSLISYALVTSGTVNDRPFIILLAYVFASRSPNIGDLVQWEHS